MTDQTKIRTGDRVRATCRKNQDTAEFTVTHAYDSGALESKFGFFRDEDWEFEVLDRPIPTTPGLYFFARGLIYLALNNRGCWYQVDFTSPSALAEQVDAPQVEYMFNRHAGTLVHEFVPWESAS
jgi:hypothetical protein